MTYTILVNSSDGFEDCWEPFFKLFKKYWGSCNTPIILNTEFKTYNDTELDICSSQSHVNTTDRKLTWSECLINCLEKVETPLVLYLQEDYFIQDYVNSEIINDFANLMLEKIEIKHIGLTNFGSTPPFFKYTYDDRLSVIGKSSKYRISTQAGLWDRKTLLSYLKIEENGWMFEIFGSMRARYRNDLFLTVNPIIFNNENGVLINYIHTGIIKGKWHTQIPKVFNENEISIDFEKRGFYKKKSILLTKIETAKKLLKKPINVISPINFESSNIQQINSYS